MYNYFKYTTLLYRSYTHTVHSICTYSAYSNLASREYNITVLYICMYILLIAMHQYVINIRFCNCNNVLKIVVNYEILQSIGSITIVQIHCIEKLKNISKHSE